MLLHWGAFSNGNNTEAIERQSKAAELLTLRLGTAVIALCTDALSGDRVFLRCQWLMWASCWLTFALSLSH